MVVGEHLSLQRQFPIEDNITQKNERCGRVRICVGGKEEIFYRKVIVVCVRMLEIERVLSESLVLFIILLFLMKKGGGILLQSAERLQENVFQRTYGAQVSSILRREQCLNEHLEFGYFSSGNYDGTLQYEP